MLRIRTDTLLVAFVTTLFFWVISDLATKGMTLDGTLYAGIARDMAAGIGSFWYPAHFIDGVAFHDHPPLGLYLQSLTFRLVGDEFWTENLYSAVILLATVAALIWLFRLVEQMSGQDQSSWYGILMLFISPLAAWAYTNNYLENTLTLMGLITLGCCLCSVRSTGSERWVFCVLAGLGVSAGLLVKGPVALWPLAFYPVYGLIFKMPKTPIVAMAAVQGLAVVLMMLLIWFFTDGGSAIQHYLTAQLGGTFSGARAAQYGRTEVLLVLGKNLVGPLIYSALLMIVFRSRPVLSRWVLLFFVLACSASLPLMLSPRQYEHYLLPSLPLFAMSFGFIAAPMTTRFCRWIEVHQKKFFVALVVLLAIAVSSYAGKYGSVSDDKDHLAFVDLSRSYLQQGDVVQLCAGFTEDRIRAYLYRYLSVRSSASGATFELCLDSMVNEKREIAASHGPFVLYPVQ